MLVERLMENLDLRVEPFAVCALAQGWRLNLPAPEKVTLHFVLQGECRLIADGVDVLPMGANMLAVVPSTVAHAIECGEPIEHEAEPTGDERSPCSLIQLSAGPGDREFRAACGRIEVSLGGGLGLFDLLREPVVLDFSENERMRNLFAELIEEERSASSGSRAMIAALMNQCLVALLRRLDEQTNGRLPWLAAAQDPRLAPVMEAVLTKPGDPHSLESLAERSGMSRSSFAERFAAGTGRTPMDFVREVRIRRAAKLLLSTELSVDGVADRVGFASRSHFSRAFRDYFAQTPTNFRHAARAGEPA